MKLIGAAPAMAALIALVACGQAGQGGNAGRSSPTMPDTTVDTAKVEVRPLAVEIETVGTLRADEAAVMRPEVAGRIEAIHFKEGQRVSAGALLFSLDASLNRADLKEATANLESSRRSSLRADELARMQLVAGADVDKAKAALEVDRARAASARARLEKTQIRAPFDGVVGLRNVSVGDYVGAGQALVDLVRFDPIEVDLNVPEANLGRVRVGQVALFNVDAFPGESFEGEIVAIAPTVAAGGHIIALRARIPNHSLTLRPGLFARARLILGENPTALVVPEEAILPKGDKNMVFLVSLGVVSEVPVQLGRRLPGLVEIASGLKPGDVVVRSGHQKLRNGTKVSPRQGLLGS